MTRQLSLNAFLHDTGHHEASWRHPDSAAERVYDIDFVTENAQMRPIPNDCQNRSYDARRT